MDPNSTNPPSDTTQQSQEDTVQPEVTPPSPAPSPVNEPDTASMAPAVDNGQTPIEEQPVQAAPTADDYIENVGGSLIDLMDEVNGDDNLIQMVAQEMKLDVSKTKSILTTLLDKVDKEQLSIEELAFIMAVTIVDEPQGTQK